MADTQQQDPGLTRRDLVRAGSAGALSIAGAGLLSACGGGKSSAAAGTRRLSVPPFSSGPASGGTPVRGGVLRIGMPTGGAAETIDVRHLATNPDVCRAPQLYDPLVFAGNDSGLLPALATEWEANADATAWTFKLRDGVVFHDGRPLTADDLVYTVKASWGSKENVVYGIMSQLVDFKNVRKRDELTVEIPLLRGSRSSRRCSPRATRSSSRTGRGSGTPASARDPSSSPPSRRGAAATSPRTRTTGSRAGRTSTR